MKKKKTFKQNVNLNGTPYRTIKIPKTNRITAEMEKR